MKTRTDLRLRFQKETGKRVAENLGTGYIYVSDTDVEYLEWLEENLLKWMNRL